MFMNIKFSETIVTCNRGEWLRNMAGRALCCVFSLAILGVDPAQNLEKYKRWLRMFIQPNNRGIAIMKVMHRQ